jgi:cell division protein FtsB
MSQPWWRRLLPGSSKLLLVGGVVLIAVVALGFIELFNIQGEAVADRASARAQVQQLTEQKQQLQQELAAAQHEDNVEPKARQFFKYSRPDEKKVVFQTPTLQLDTAVPTPVPPGSTSPAGQPAWLEWLNRLLRG